MIARPPRLWIIDPSVAVAEDEGVSELLEGWRGEARLFRPSLEAGSGPDAATGYDTDGIVVMGSRASVHEAPPWLIDLGSWLRPLVSGEVRRPLLGICFGHQLLGHLAGAEVGFVRADESKLVGVAKTRLAGGRLLPGTRELHVIVSHREQLRDVPRGWRVTAARPEVPVDGFEHAHLPMFGVQFHPEAREVFAARNAIDLNQLDERWRRDSREVLDAFRASVEREFASGPRASRSA